MRANGALAERWVRAGEMNSIPFQIYTKQTNYILATQTLILQQKKTYKITYMQTTCISINHKVFQAKLYIGILRNSNNGLNEN